MPQCAAEMGKLMTCAAGKCTYSTVAVRLWIDCRNGEDGSCWDMIWMLEVKVTPLVYIVDPTVIFLFVKLSRIS